MECVKCVVGDDGGFGYYIKVRMESMNAVRTEGMREKRYWSDLKL